ncbi:MAG: ATP-binding protein [Muribaculaceae bacterium]|nr:ATP-binding protein [Muribaculaceae bacterium]
MAQRERVVIKNFGPIQEVDVELGDLTVLIGAQASGKSLFLQMFKLLKDKSAILQLLENYGFVVNNKLENLLNRYLGEGLASMWTDKTELKINNRIFARQFFEKNTKGNSTDKVFYIPAQRILSISDGRPKYFMEFSENDPFVLRKFSDILRLFTQSGLGEGGVIYPLPNRLKPIISEMYNKAIFHDGKVEFDEKGSQRKLVMNVGNMHLPLMTWSTGQKEFMPLLMAFYCLTGSSQNIIKREQYEYIIIEEPEMGLHPLAIQTIILQIIEFMDAGYKVIVSTHSPVLLEFVWAYNYLKKIPPTKRVEALYELFGIQDFNRNGLSFMGGIFDKEIKTYYFSRNKEGKVSSKDISSLDVFSEDIAVNEWGGLTQFSSKTNEIVSMYMAQYGE